jgi:16S rRNA (cytosine1402-N4)-methyltransferase
MIATLETTYHNPVLLQQSIDGLNLQPGGVYLDVTFGGGGHSKEILCQLNGGKLFAIDQDNDAAENAKTISDNRFTFYKTNFAFAANFLQMGGVTQLDGILADLGVSSHQFDTGERGFSIRFDGPLDMRMDRQAELTAADIIGEWTAAELQQVLGMYGEVHNAKTLANLLVAERAISPILTTSRLKETCLKVAPKPKHNQYLAQVFQALRIAVNDELETLKTFLETSAKLLKPGGRLVVISYHSLEDRLVKNFMQKGKMYGEADKDIYGNELKPLDPVNRKAIVPDDLELALNPRARSAKLRIAQKR